MKNQKGIPATRIYFNFNDDNVFGCDETEFDTRDERELAELWWEFCKENHFIEIEHIVALE